MKKYVIYLALAVLLITGCAYGSLLNAKRVAENVYPHSHGLKWYYHDISLKGGYWKLVGLPSRDVFDSFAPYVDIGFFGSVKKKHYE